VHGQSYMHFPLVQLCYAITNLRGDAEWQ